MLAVVVRAITEAEPAVAALVRLLCVGARVHWPLQQQLQPLDRPMPRLLWRSLYTKSCKRRVIIKGTHRDK